MTDKELDFSKVVSTIESCINKKQLESSQNMIENWFDKHQDMHCYMTLMNVLLNKEMTIKYATENFKQPS